MNKEDLDRNAINYIRNASLNQESFDKTINGYISLLGDSKPEKYELDVLEANKSEEAYRKWELAYVARKEAEMATYREEQRQGKAGYLVNPKLSDNDKRLIMEWNNPSLSKASLGVTASTGLLKPYALNDEDKAVLAARNGVESKVRQSRVR